MTTFTVLETRPKSHKLQAEDGTTFFIKKSWMREDGSFTPAVKKAYAEAVEKAKDNKKMLDLPEIAWENEKCVGVDFRAEQTLSSSVGGHPKRVRVFVPKSMIQSGKVPAWLWSKKLDEADAKAREIHYSLAIVTLWSGDSLLLAA